MSSGFAFSGVASALYSLKRRCERTPHISVARGVQPPAGWQAAPLLRWGGVFYGKLVYRHPEKSTFFLFALPISFYFFCPPHFFRAQTEWKEMGKGLPYFSNLRNFTKFSFLFPVPVPFASETCVENLGFFLGKKTRSVSVNDPSHKKCKTSATFRAPSPSFLRIYLKFRKNKNQWFFGGKLRR